MEYQNIICLIFAYLIGAIPTSVWVGKLFYNIDVREYGSGNAGATNTFRVLGKKPGIFVLIFDVLKGFVAVKLPFVLGYYEPGTTPFVNFQLILGIIALIGHVFPVYVGFRGGKGIATLLGVIMALHIYAALVAIAIFLVVFLLSKIVSLSSIIAAICFPFNVIFLFKVQHNSLIIFSILIAVIVLITHHKNIGRLLRKEESKMNLKLKNASVSNDDDNDE